MSPAPRVQVRSPAGAAQGVSDAERSPLVLPRQPSAVVLACRATPANASAASTAPSLTPGRLSGNQTAADDAMAKMVLDEVAGVAAGMDSAAVNAFGRLQQALATCSLRMAAEYPRVQPPHSQQAATTSALSNSDGGDLLRLALQPKTFEFDSIAWPGSRPQLAGALPWLAVPLNTTVNVTALMKDFMRQLTRGACWRKPRRPA